MWKNITEKLNLAKSGVLVARLGILGAVSARTGTHMTVYVGLVLSLGTEGAEKNTRKKCVCQGRVRD